MIVPEALPTEIRLRCLEEVLLADDLALFNEAHEGLKEE